VIYLGLIGAGAWGKNYIDAAKETGIAEVVQTERNWRIGTNVDAFVIATPPEPRADLICDIINGIGTPPPMMVEKPLCLSIREAERVRTFLDPKIPFLVDYTHLFSPAYERLRSFVQQHPGRIRVYGRTSSHAVRTHSPLWDHAPHDLAMCLGLGLEKIVHATAAKSADGSHWDMDVHFDCGAAAHIRVSQGPKHKTMVVMCGGMGGVYNADDGSLQINGKPVEVSRERPLTRAVRAFAEAVRDGGTDDWRFGIDSSMSITKALEMVHVGAG
jgi:predicted dehydrogenase